ncbi:DUF932 domain-containing protein [Amycolatopsis jejuensis]|uniref:DUF932 domain-containing protein n=1 Tax=Amycolatopsis jejuensis TaxID=330084 RepID=UPI00052599AF|nr:DUF932 domain-containing protein [Amycolatopsis jejuensis]
MSKETLTWLNTNTLVGFTEKRGKAWHYRASDQTAEPNHYPGAIPVEDVNRRLFYWDAVKGTSLVSFTHGDDIAVVEDTKRFPVGRADTGAIFGYFADGYAIHQYRDWLVSNVATILDDDLHIGSAGLLKGGAQAWVSVEVPENITTPEGVEFRPNLLACTSLDGSLATTYKRTVTVVVCDNTLAAGLHEHGQQVKIKHSKYSNLRMTEVRDALAIVHTVADDFAAEVKALCETEVSDKAWRAFLDAHAPIEGKSKRATTMAEAERAELSRLWNFDHRAAPWKNTAYGVVQAVNTYTHHAQPVRGASRPERNMVRAVTGGVDKLDAQTVATLDTVLASLA